MTVPKFLLSLLSENRFMKGKILFAIVFVLGLNSESNLFAQNIPTFNKIYGVIGNLPNESNSIIPISNGYVLYGETKDSNNFSRISIIKIDTIGNLIWEKSYGKKDSNYWSIFAFGGGGVSVPWGGFLGVGYIGNDTGTWGTWDKLALFRFDNNGDTVWTRTYSDTARLEGWFVKVARKKKYILGCNWFAQKTYYFYTPSLTLTDSIGNRIWQKTYHATLNHFRFLTGMDTCKDGGYIFCANDWDTNYPGQEAENIVIIKTDSAGNPEWTKFIPPPHYAIEGDNILSLKDGGYIVCGTQGTKNSWPSNYPILYMTKLNDTGGIVWSNTYGSLSPPEVGTANLIMARELPDGDIITCGQEANTTLDTLMGCILRVDSTGKQKWLRYYYKQSPQEQDYLFNIEPTVDGGYIACGSTYGNTENTWVVKTDSMGCDTTDCNYTGIEPLKENNIGLEVFPNPSAGRLTIAFSGTQNVLSGRVEIYNVLGEKVLKQILRSTQPARTGTGGDDKVIDLTNQPNGIYLYRVISDTGNLIGEGKVIIQK